MKKIYLLLLFSLFIINSWSQDFNRMISVGTYTVQEIQTEAEAYFAVRGTGKGTGYKQYKRWEYQALRDMDIKGYLKSPNFYFNELERYNSYINKNRLNAKTAANDSGNWVTLGPTYWGVTTTAGWNPGVGRLTSIAYHASAPNTIIVGAETGGVWKTEDGGSNWTVKTDSYTNMVVYSLAIDPANPLNYFWGSENGAMFKSVDGGNTWNVLNASIGYGKINRILIDPANSSRMYCSIDAAGLYKSTDGGVNWDYIIPGGADGTNLYGFDFELKPGDPTVVYASGHHFYKSTDSGANFTKITIANSNVPNDGAKMLAVTPADNSLVYVLEASSAISDGYFKNLFKSADSGDTFTTIDHTGQNYFGYGLTSNEVGDETAGQAPRDMDIAISPIDANEIHIAGVNTWRSLDGGNTFSATTNWNVQDAAANNIGYSHADVDLLEFIGNTLYTCTDGGIFKATNSGGTMSAAYFTDLSTGMGIRQFYKFGITQSSPVMISGGSQDNGTSVYDANYGDWKDWLGGDGIESFIDKNNFTVWYGTNPEGSMQKSTNSGASYTNLTDPEGPKAGNWYTPFEQDPSALNTIYAGFKHVQKSTDGGTSWSPISQDFGSPLNHLKIAPTLNTTMYASLGTDLYKTTTGSGTWTTVSGVSGTINSIAIHPTNPDKVAVATTDASGKVYVTTDGGTNWTNYTYDLPAFSALALVWDDNGHDGLYLGMNYGVFYIDNITGSSWLPFSNNLPNVKISELEVNYADNKLYAATYGRGAWTTNRFDVITLKVDSFNELSTLSVYPNPATNNLSLKWDKNDDVSIRIFNALGKLMYYTKDISLTNKHSIDISNYASGLYFVRINNESGIITKKVMKN